MTTKVKVVVIAILVLTISSLQFWTDASYRYLHIIYRESFFLPIILAGLWFALKGALASSLAITVLYLPITLSHWDNLSPNDFSLLVDKLIYNIAAVVLGVMKNRENAEHKRVLKAENLASVGKAVAAIAHDMKTPLIAIGGFTTLVQKEFERDDPRHKKLGIAIDETRRLETMVKEMLYFSRLLELKPSPGNINKVILESTEIVVRAIEGQKVSIAAHLSDRLPMFSFDESRIKEVLINLLMNAVQASPEGGTVTVSTIQRGEHVQIDVADCGPGIPLENREKIFTPFFTTKKEGTGLGLSIVKKIIEAHKGKINVLDNKPKGTIFKILLPKREGHVAQTESQADGRDVKIQKTQ